MINLDINEKRTKALLLILLVILLVVLLVTVYLIKKAKKTPAPAPVAEEETIEDYSPEGVQRAIDKRIEQKKKESENMPQPEPVDREEIQKAIIERNESLSSQSSDSSDDSSEVAPVEIREVPKK